MEEGKTLWTPSAHFIANSRLNDYKIWLGLKNGISPATPYKELWQWSIDNPVDFWQSIWQYFDIESSTPFSSVLSGEMPRARWFEGSSVNFAEQIFLKADPDRPAILFQSERHPLAEISWGEVRSQTARLQKYLFEQGVSRGERVGAFLPNIPEATYGFLATSALGAIWSSCSPDFGASSVVDRLKQIEPKVLLAVDGYSYGGKSYDKTEVVKSIVEQIPSIQKVVLIPYLDGQDRSPDIPNAVSWGSATASNDSTLRFEPVFFDHPLWVLYSSGTTGIPKAITHSHGGILLEHLKYLAFHNDVHEGERFFWFSTTGWMMWNFVQGALLHGATIVLYDGSPGYPDLNVLWKLAEEARIDHFGTSAPFLVACMKEGLQPGKTYDLASLRSVSSTGAPLPPEAFEWVYEGVGSDIWLCSMSGGTDVCTAFVGGCPERPVRSSEIQCRALGVSLYAYDENARPVEQELGEMVITKPMPSMPIYFWNDPSMKRYLGSYFEDYPGVWRHGDYVKITESDGVIMYGRSDATLNRQGVRIGTAEIYRALNNIPEIKDAIIVHIDSGSSDFMPLFVVPAEDKTLSDDLVKQIRTTIRTLCSPRHVPDQIIEIADVPYTISGKKMEMPVKKILSGKDVSSSLNRDAMRNPEALDFFIEFAKNLKVS